MPSNVCIVGGGPAGLAAAIALTQVGVRATVVDHAFPPIDKACGEGLMPDTVKALSELGVHVSADAGYRFRGICFLDSRSSVAADFPNGYGVGLRRTVLHDLLVQRARDLGIRQIWAAKSPQTYTGYDFLIAADGQNSVTRKTAGLDKAVRHQRRFAFRRHFRVAPWSSYVDVHWGPKCQLYVSPVARDEVSLICISKLPQLRIDAALKLFPAVRERVQRAQPASREMGGLSVSRKLRNVVRDNVALIGDASGSVDAITGEGLGLAFKQALLLAESLKTGTLREYQKEHSRLLRRPYWMGQLMLTLDSNPSFQRRAMASLAARPGIFASLLGVHIGAQPFTDLVSWQLLNLCRDFLHA